MPVYVFLKFQRMPALICGDKVHIFCLKQAVLISVDEPRMKSDGEIITVLSVFHIAGVKGISVAEKSLAFRQKIFLIIYKIFDLSGHDPGKFDLRMPVPGEGMLFVGLYPFEADMDGKFIIPVLFNLLMVFSVLSFIVCLQFLNILIILSNILIV